MSAMVSSLFQISSFRGAAKRRTRKPYSTTRRSWIPGLALRRSRNDKRSLVALRRLPARQRVVRLGDGRIHDFLLDAGRGGQFDDIAVRVAEVDRANKAVIDRAANLDPLRHAL